MGWTYTHKDSEQSVREFFEKEFNYQRDDGTFGKILDCAVVNMRTAYIAYQTKTNQDLEAKVIAIVCLLDYSPRDYHNFGYKDMDESMGPCEDHCPERILRMLSPLPDDESLKYAKEWRERCWSYARRPKLKDGMVIKFSNPIEGHNGYKEDTFRVCVDGRRRSFVGLNMYPNVRWRLRSSNLQDDFTVIQSIQS